MEQSAVTVTKSGRGGARVRSKAAVLTCALGRHFGDDPDMLRMAAAYLERERQVAR